MDTLSGLSFLSPADLIPHNVNQFNVSYGYVFREYVWIFGIKKPDKQVRAGIITCFIAAFYHISDVKLSVSQLIPNFLLLSGNSL